MSHRTEAVKQAPGKAWRRDRRDFDLDPRKLRRRRLAAGLTLDGLAARAGSSKGTLSSIENGKHGPSVPLAARLAKALGCRIADLMLDEDAA